MKNKHTKNFLYSIPNLPPSLVREDDDPPDDKLVKAVNKIVHSVLSERDKRDAPKRQKEITDAVTAALGGESFKTAIGDIVKGAIPQPDPAPPGDPGKGKKEPAGGDPEMRAELARLKKIVEDSNAEREKLTKSVETERSKAIEADAKARRQEEGTALSTLLTESKIRPNLLRMATEDLHRRFIKRDANEDGTYGDPYWLADDGETKLDPKKGLAKYLATDEGKELLPAVNTGGSGSGRPTGKGSPGGKEFGFGDLGAKISGGGQ